MGDALFLYIWKQMLALTLLQAFERVHIDPETQRSTEGNKEAGKHQMNNPPY